MNILIVNQTIVDMCASFFTLITSAVTTDGTRMSNDSLYDRFICRVWLSRMPQYTFHVSSTYGILATALERYIAVIYPIWYKVRLLNPSVFAIRQYSKWGAMKTLHCIR